MAEKKLGLEDFSQPPPYTETGDMLLSPNPRQGAIPQSALENPPPQESSKPLLTRGRFASGIFQKFRTRSKSESDRANMTDVERQLRVGEGMGTGRALASLKASAPDYSAAEQILGPTIISSEDLTNIPNLGLNPTHLITTAVEQPRGHLQEAYNPLFAESHASHATEQAQLRPQLMNSRLIDGARQKLPLEMSNISARAVSPRINEDPYRRRNIGNEVNMGARPRYVNNYLEPTQLPQSSRGAGLGQDLGYSRELPREERRWEFLHEPIRSGIPKRNDGFGLSGEAGRGEFEREFAQLGINSLEKAINLGHCKETNQRILADPDVQETNNSTMGPIIFQNWINNRILNGGDASHSAIFAFCRHYASKLHEEARQKQKLQDEWKDCVRSMILESECKMLNTNKQLCRDKLFYCPTSVCGVDTPTYFSPIDVIMTPQDRSNLKNCFPLTKRWVGVGKGMTIQSWLSEFTVGQKLAKLSKPEFFQMLITCTEGEANLSMQECINRHKDDIDVNSLYEEIIRYYNEMITPVEAKQRLDAYKAVKGKTLLSIEGDILRLATRASLIYEGKSVRDDFVALETPLVLIRSLPSEASLKAQMKFNDLQRELLARPKFLEFTRALRSQEDYFNTQIAQHGIPPSAAGKSSIYIDSCTFNPNYKKNNHFSGKPFGGHQRRNQGNVALVSQDSFKQDVTSGSIKQVGFKDKKKEYQLDSGTKRSCLICGGYGHSETDLCRSQFSDSGEIVKQNSTSLGCKRCKDTFGKDLRHVDRYCPLRPRALELYAENTVNPVSVYRKYCVDNKIGNHEYKKKDNKSYGQKPQGKIRIVTVSRLVENAKTNDIPFSAFTIDTRRDLFTAKLYLDLTLTTKSVSGERQVTALFDSGADSCLMSKSYFGQTFDLFEVECYIQQTEIELSSYTNHTIDVCGEVKFDVTIPFSGGKTIPVTFIIIDDFDKEVCPMIVNLKLLGELNLNLEHRQIDEANIPVICSSADPKRSPLSQYLTDDETTMIYGVATRLEPGECKHFPFYLNNFYGQAEETDVLITEDFIPPSVNNSFIQIIPTKSCLVFDHYKKKLKGVAFVKNNGRTIFHNMPIVGRVEQTVYYKVGQIDLSNFEALIKQPFILDSPTATAEDLRVGNMAEGIRINKIKKNKANVNMIQTDSEDTFCIIPQRCLRISNFFPEDKKVRAVGDSINNGMGDAKISLTESRMKVEVSKGKLSKAEEDSFNEPDKAGQLGIKSFKEDDNFLESVKHQRGYELPDKYSNETLEEIILLDKYPEDIKVYVKDLFIDKYPELIATSTLQKGSMSDTLGKYSIRLKENVSLPKHKKVYYLAPLETQQLQAILEFLIQDGTIEKAYQQGDIYNEFSSPGYLIPRSSPGSSPRLIVNFTHLNSLIVAEPAVLPTVDSMINKLRDAYFFSVVDLANAFYSIDITEDSKPLTIFSCSLGSFAHKKLPTGLRTSPEALNRFVAKAIHYEPIFDEQGNQQWEKDGTLKMKYAPISNALFIYDDVLIFSEAKGTYEASLKAHNKVLGSVMHRLHYHKCKLSIHKSQLFKTKINFFGYYIQNKFVYADPKRIQKVLDTPKPTTPKGIRSFLGVINSMRDKLGFNTLQHFGELTSLTSGKLRSFTFDDKQETAFNGMKESLTTGPIYSNIIDMNAAKLIFSDMSGGTNACYSAVLCQVVYPKEGQNTVPANLNLLDKCHAVLYDHKIMAYPLPLKHKDQLLKNYLKRITSGPPDFSYLETPFLGFSEADAPNSLGICLKLMLDVSGCSINFHDLCKSISSHIRSTVKRYSFIDFIFNKDIKQFDMYIKELEAGRFMIDKKLYIFDAIAECLFRPVSVISSVKEFSDISEFNAVKTKPPLYFLLHKVGDMYIVRPGVADKDASYKLANFRGTLEVISYACKTIHQKQEHLHILDLELQAILFAIESFRKVCGNAPTLLLCDSQPLFHLFNSFNLSSNKKISRWNYRVLQALPQLVIKHVISAENISDFLTRQYKVDQPNLPKLQLSRFNTTVYDDLIPDITFNLKEWTDFVEKHKDFIFTTQNKEVKGKKGNIAKVKVNSPELKAIATVLTPIQVLKDRLSNAEIAKHQSKQFKDIIDACNIADKQRKTIDKKEYFLNNGTLCIKIDNTNKLMCPDTMLPLFISYAHVTSLHGGEGKMRLSLQHLYHKELLKYIKIYTRSCYGCAISQTSTHLNKLGLYPMPARPFHTVSLDYIQDLPPFRGYKHILVVTCQLSGAIYGYPTTTLTSKEFLRVFLFNVLQLLSPKKVLCDNATSFINKDVIIELGASGVQVIHTTSHNPRGKGQVEKANHTLKLALMKIIGNKKNYNWMYSVPIICKQFNSVRLNKHGLPPCDLIFGKGTSTDFGDFEMLPDEQIHPVIGSEITAVKKRHEEIHNIMGVVKDKLQSERIERIKKINKTRLDKDFKVDELVLIKNFGYIPGIRIGLRAPYHHSPYRVLEVFSVSLVGLRLTDNHIIKVHANDAKRLYEVDDKFKDLPKEVLTVMETPFHMLTDQQISNLILKDDFVIPKSILDKYESMVEDSGLKDVNNVISIDDETNEAENVEDLDDDDIIENAKEKIHYLRPRKRVNYANPLASVNN